jgi:hypothetical protein
MSESVLIGQLAISMKTTLLQPGWQAHEIITEKQLKNALDIGTNLHENIQ